jgi:hypothetical protein
MSSIGKSEYDQTLENVTTHPMQGQDTPTTIWRRKKYRS